VCKITLKIKSILISYTNSNEKQTYLIQNLEHWLSIYFIRSVGKFNHNLSYKLLYLFSIIYFAIRCLVNMDEEVIVPDPGFPTYFSAIKFCGAKAVRVAFIYFIRSVGKFNHNLSYKLLYLFSNKIQLFYAQCRVNT
jgi:hypothetical protein